MHTHFQFDWPSLRICQDNWIVKSDHMPNEYFINSLTENLTLGNHTIWDITRHYSCFCCYLQKKAYIMQHKIRYDLYCMDSRDMFAHNRQVRFLDSLVILAFSRCQWSNSPLLLTLINLNPSISDHIHYKVWGDITYTFPKQKRTKRTMCTSGIYSFRFH